MAPHFLCILRSRLIQPLALRVRHVRRSMSQPWLWQATRELKGPRGPPPARLFVFAWRRRCLRPSAPSV